MLHPLFLHLHNILFTIFGVVIIDPLYGCFVFFYVAFYFNFSPAFTPNDLVFGSLQTMKVVAFYSFFTA